MKQDDHSLELEDQNGAYIDNRQFGRLQHVQLLPARTRRRTSHEILPLTNRNLQTFNESVSPTNRTIAIDMDRYVDEQESLNFGESNPSDSGSSLDDVCLDYQDHPQWPDLSCLGDFIEQQKKDKSKPGVVSWEGDDRFTYFRDDLPNTIHASSLGGLLQSSKKVDEQAHLKRKWQDTTPPTVSVDDNYTLEQLFAPRLAPQGPLGPPAPLGPQGPLLGPGGAQLGPQMSLPRGATPHPSLGNISAGTRTPEPSTLNGTRTPMTDGLVSDGQRQPFWLDVLDPLEEEMKALLKTFGIHPLTTEDIFLGEAREKVELFPQYYFICFTSFDIIYERRKQRIREHERKMLKMQELEDRKPWVSRVYDIFHHKEDVKSAKSSTTKSKKKVREGELSPLLMYMTVFRDAVITFHFSPTPHPINVRRRTRLLKDYLTVSSDWICYALIDDITDSFAPMIESIELEVNAIEEAILRMHAGDNLLDSDDSDDETEEAEPVFFKRARSRSVVGGYQPLEQRSKSSTTSKSSKSTATILGWKRKGDMLRRIGECRKRVMSLLRLLGSKADVIKGFNKRLNESGGKLEITIYLGDIQDHIVTMVQLLNHYEKLLARFHSNYLAQINIDMTKVNNDTNDVLGKITILGTIVLPINVVTGLWGMNCIVPGQDYPGLTWFYSIICGMALFLFFAYNYAKRAYGL